MSDFAIKAREFGFTHVEIDSTISPEELEELLQATDSISSIHSPCPATVSSKGIWANRLSLSSLDEEQREAIQSAKLTIELASRVGAKVAVLHLGEVPLLNEWEDKLHELYDQGLVDSEEYKQVKQQLIIQRASNVAPYLEAARRSLWELANYGEQWGIVLGLETRFYFHEIPSLEEMEKLIEELGGSPVGYWHDVGHAEVKHRLGFTSHEEWFLHFKDKLIGVHLHDVLRASDHYAPGRGDMDWGLVAKHLPAGAIRVCEIGEWNEEKYLRGVLPFLREKGILT
jgi:sugar phosphate isomerase/epimerase